MKISLRAKPLRWCIYGFQHGSQLRVYFLYTPTEIWICEQVGVVPYPRPGGPLCRRIPRKPDLAEFPPNEVPRRLAEYRIAAMIDLYAKTRGIPKEIIAIRDPDAFEAARFAFALNIDKLTPVESERDRYATHDMTRIF